MNKKAPIALFVYNRPEHTKRCLKSLSENLGFSDSKLYIYCDGPKDGSDRENVKEVVDIANDANKYGNVQVVVRLSNYGCAQSIIDGVTQILEKYKSVIVVEDDLVLSKYFLNYMNTALNYYEKNTNVMQISGYMYPVNLDIKHDTFFLSIPTSWGWGTWQRAFKHLDTEMLYYEQIINDSSLRSKFNFYDSYDFFGLLEKQKNNVIDSWGIRWYLTTFMLNGLTLYPHNSLVNNSGFDGSGTHCGVNNKYNNELNDFNPQLFSNNIESSEIVETIMVKYFESLTPPRKSIVNRVTKRLLKIINT